MKQQKDKKHPLTNNSSEEDKKTDSKKSKNFLQYSGMAFQLGATIFLGAWGGTRLDAYFGFEKHILTGVLTILSVVVAVYFAIKDLIKD